MRDRQGKLQLVPNLNISIEIYFIRLPLYYSEPKIIKLFDKISLIILCNSLRVCHLQENSAS